MPAAPAGEPGADGGEGVAGSSDGVSEGVSVGVVVDGVQQTDHAPALVPPGPQQAVHAYDPASGRTLDCLTTEPGVGIYTAGFFDGTVAGLGGRYQRYAGFTLETQHAPDSPNHPGFPSTELKPGQVFDSTTVFRFGVQR